MLGIPKLDWAKEGLDRLQAESQEWFRGNRSRVTSEPDRHPSRRRQTAFYVEADPIPEWVALTVGDCLQQMRAGLDHIAFTLATNHTGLLPDDWAEASEFPIFGDDSTKGVPGTGHARFTLASKAGIPGPTSGLGKIRGMHADAQAIIQGLQPYQRGTKYRDDPLWRLQELSRIDKHRLLHVVVAAFDGVVVAPRPGQALRIGAGAIISNAAVVEGRTFVSSIPISGLDALQQMRVQAMAPLKPTFSKGVPLVGGQPIVAVLGAIYEHIEQLVVPPLRPYL